MKSKKPIKLFFVGKSGVGKSSLNRKVERSKFPSYNPSHLFSHLMLARLDEEEFLVNMIDTIEKIEEDENGDEKDFFEEECFKSDTIILVYDVSNENS